MFLCCIVLSGCRILLVKRYVPILFLTCPTCAHMQVKFKVQADVHSLFVASVAPCEQAKLCGNKNVSFSFEFLDPLALRAVDFLPTQEYTYGKSTMMIQVKNLPMDISTNDIMVEFVQLRNQSVISIDRSKSDAVVEVKIPQSSNAALVPIKVYCLSLNQVLDFRTPFVYMTAPTPSVTRIVPSSAPVQTSTRVRISLHNFPMAKTTADIKVRLQWGSTTVPASVISMSTQSASEHAIQDINIDVDTPVGSTVKEGVPDVIIYHQQFGETKAAILRGNFLMIDNLNPQIMQLRSSSSIGTSKVQVPMSVSSEVTAVVENSPRPIDLSTSAYIVQMGDTVLDILSADVTDDREAKIIFTTFPSSSIGEQYGIIAFGTSCSSTCCQDVSCSTACPGVKIACFTLQYFDDTLPVLTIKSDLSGPEIGGDILKLEITNFPILSSLSDVLVSYQLRDSVEFVDGISVDYSNAESGTGLTIVTPAFDGITVDQAVEFAVVPKGNPSRAVSFSYTVQTVLPAIKSFTPAAGLATGGQNVLVEILYFDYHTGVQIMFGNDALPDTSIEVLSISNRLSAKIRFITPETEPGDFEVMIKPKTCAAPCPSAVRITIQQIDASLPEIVAPIPTGASFQLSKMPPIYLSNVPDDAHTFAVHFEDSELSANVYVAQGVIKNGKLEGVRLLLADTPQGINQPGTFMVSVSFRQAKGMVKRSAPFYFHFYDGFVPRVANVKPLMVPTSGLVAGRKLQLQSEVSIVCVNFPHNLATTESFIAVFSPSSQSATILEVRQEVTCLAHVPDCNRTLIVLQTPALESPGLQELQIMQPVPGQAPKQIFVSYIEYAPPCDFDQYCADRGLISNFKLLVDKPQIGCSILYCVDPALIGNPVVIKISPSEGLKSGGTVVKVNILNLPAFARSDVMVKVKSTTSAQIAQIRSLSQTDSSSLMSSRGELTFVTPQFTSTDEFATVEIATTLAGKQKAVSFAFEYLPVIVGPAVAAAYSPKSLFDGEPLNVRVKIANVPRLSFPYSSQGMMIIVSGVEVAANDISILSSDRYSTTLTFTATYTPEFGQISILLGSRISGVDSLGPLLIRVDEIPAPRIVSSYPALDSGVAGNAPLQISTRIEYLPPDLILPPNSFSVQLMMKSSQYAVDLIDIYRLMESSCTRAYCSLIEFRYLIPALSDDDSKEGGTANLTVSSSAGTVSLSAGLVFRPSGSPSIEMIMPGSLSLTEEQNVQIFLRYYPTAICHTNSPPSCASDAEGLALQFDSVQNPEIKLEDSKGRLVISFAAPVGERAGEEKGRIMLGKGIQPLEFALHYDMPAAEVMPKDGSLLGNGVITITAKGWWGNGENLEAVPSREAISIDMGGLMLEPSRILSVQSKSLSLVVVVRIPESKVAGTIACSIGAQINGVQKASRFLFEYFNNPEFISVSPGSATLKGKTTSKDGRSVLLKIKNFPAVTLAGDVLLTFGKHTCAVGSSCEITEIRSSQEADGNVLSVRARVPPATAPGTVTISIQPASSSPERQLKRAEAILSYYRPLPVISSMRWCQTCAKEARTCIVMGKCSDGSMPLDGLVPMSGGGVVTLQVTDPPDFRFVESNGVSEAMIMLALGTNNYAEFLRVAYGNGKNQDGEVEKSDLVALEFAIPGLSSSEGDQAVLSILPAGGLASSSASQVFAFFDNAVTLQCLQGCDSAATGTGYAVVAVTNLPLDPSSAAVSQVDAMIGLFEALSVQFDETPYCPADNVCLRLGVPSCSDCDFENGFLEVLLSVSLKGDPMRGSTTRFRYYSAPSILSATFNAIGTSISVSFNQNTDMGNLKPGFGDCEYILEPEILPRLAALKEDATCVWGADDLLNIFLGPGATISPGDSIAIRKDTLRSKNSISGPCTSISPVSAPEFAVAPTVSVSGSDEIDPCSDLELRAMADSPRPLMFAWSCRNDDILTEALSSVTTSVVYLKAGTQEMQAVNKAYEIVVVAIDFLGTSSAPVVFPVLKKSSPAPKLTFVPPTLSMFRDESSLVKVVATFSKCPIERGKLMFSWYLMSSGTGSTVNPKIFSVTGSQLLIPSGVLEAGQTYTVGVNAYMDTDPSKATKGTYEINVKYRALSATIHGGSSKSASTSRALVLDSGGSTDPDFDGKTDADLFFTWSCSIRNGKFSDACRTKDGAQLTLPNVAAIELSADTLSNIYPTFDDPYVFTVMVTKGSKFPATYSMPVSLTEAVVPDVSIEAGSGERLPSGQIRINPTIQLVVFGECRVIREDLAENLTMTWRFEPAISEGAYEVMAEVGVTTTTHKRETLIVGADADAFIPGSSYTVQFTCADATGESSTTKISLAVNAPPRGKPCEICRLEGTACVDYEPRNGEPIFDTFRYSCLSWADEDSPLEYQFAYSGVFDGEFVEVSLDWTSSPVIDLIFPPGDVSVKARVRDSFGGSTEWMDGGQVHVATQITKFRRRKMLQSVDRWGEAEQTLQDNVDLADFAKINQLVGALAMEINTRVANADDTDVEAVHKKELLLRVLRTAIANAIKTEGYVCEASSVATAVSSNVQHVSVSSLLQLAEIITDLSASGEAHALSSECAQNLLALIASGLDSTFENRTCLSTGLIDSNQQAHVTPFMSDAELSLEHMLRKTSPSLLPGQNLLLQNANSSTSYSYSVSKMSTAASIEGLMFFRGESDDQYSYSMPEEVRLDPRVVAGSAVSVLFGAFAHPPALYGINPVSPIVTLNLADHSGRMIAVHNLTAAVNITIQLSSKGLCAAEKRQWTGEARCLYFDAHSSSYKRNGCTTHRVSKTAVTCMCTHLTSFVVEPVFDPGAECDLGTYLELGEYSRTCWPCVSGTFSNDTDMTSCLQCGVGKFSGDGSSTCTECEAGKFAAFKAAARCVECEAGTYSSEPGATGCARCAAGKYLSVSGADSEANCTLCGKGKYSSAEGASTKETCTSCSAGKYSTVSGADSGDTCIDCGAGKYSSTLGAVFCTSCPAGTYSNTIGIADAASCTRCPNNAGSPSGSTVNTSCTCNEGYQGPNGGTCLLYAALTNVEIIYSSIVPATSNNLTVTFEANLEIRAGATIRLSGFTSTGTKSGTILLTDDDQVAWGTGQWDQGSGSLSFTTPGASSRISFGFTLQNPATAQNAPTPTLTVLWPSGLELSQNLSASTALTVCEEEYFGNDCSQRCYGTVIGRACVCPADYFGHDCKILGIIDSKASVPAVDLKAGEAKTVKSELGLGVDIPAGALTSGVTLQVKVYDVEVTISKDQPGNAISSAGPVGVFLPHGLQFAVPVSMVLKYDPSKIPPGHAVYVYYYNENSLPPAWEKMEGNIVGPGLVETKTTHFSTFGAMSTELPGPKILVPVTTPPPVDDQSENIDPKPEDKPIASDNAKRILLIIAASVLVAMCTFGACLCVWCIYWKRIKVKLSSTQLLGGEDEQRWTLQSDAKLSSAPSVQSIHMAGTSGSEAPSTSSPGSRYSDWIKCPGCSRPVKSSWPRCPNADCLKALPHSKEKELSTEPGKVAPSAKSSTVADLRRDLTEFYLAWGQAQNLSRIFQEASAYKV